VRSGSTIVGMGRCVPERVLANAELAATVATTDEWIESHTGIKERHIARPETATSDLAYGAAVEALAAAALTGSRSERRDRLRVCGVVPGRIRRIPPPKRSTSP